MRAILAAALLVIIPAASSAHHSAGATYDAAKTATVDGVVVQVTWINPHVEIELQLADQSRWVLETRPPGFFVREGVSKSDLEGFVGQKAALTVNPARDGSKRGWLLKATFENGAVLALPAE